MSLYAFLKLARSETSSGYDRDSRQAASSYVKLTDDDNKTEMSEDARLAQQLQQEEIAGTQSGVKTYPKWNWIPISRMSKVNTDKNLHIKKDGLRPVHIFNKPEKFVEMPVSNVFNKREKFDEIPLSNGCSMTEYDLQKKVIEQSQETSAKRESNLCELQNGSGIGYIGDVVSSHTVSEILRENKTKIEGNNGFINRHGASTDVRNQGQNKASSDKPDYIQDKDKTIRVTDFQDNTPSNSHSLVATDCGHDMQPTGDKMVNKLDYKLVSGGLENQNMKGKISEMEPPESVMDFINNKVQIQTGQQTDSLAKPHPQLLSSKNSKFYDHNDDVKLQPHDISSYKLAHMPVDKSEKCRNVTSCHDADNNGSVENCILSNEPGEPNHSNHDKSQLQGDNVQQKHEYDHAHLPSLLHSPDHCRQDRLSRQEGKGQTVLEPNSLQNQSYKQPTDNKGACKNPEFRTEYKKQLLNSSKLNADLVQNPVDESSHNMGEVDCSRVSERKNTKSEKEDRQFSDDLQLALRLQEEEDAHYAQRLQSHNHSSSSKYKEQQSPYEDMQTHAQKTSQSSESFTATIYTTDKFLDEIFHHPWPSTLVRPTPRPMPVNRHYNKLFEKEYKELFSKKSAQTGIGSETEEFSEKFSGSTGYEKHHQRYFPANDNEEYCGHQTSAGYDSNSELPPLVYPYPKEKSIHDENNKNVSESLINNMNNYSSREAESLVYSNEYSPFLSMPDLPSAKSARNNGNGRDSYRDELKYKHLYQQTGDYLKIEKSNDVDNDDFQSNRQTVWEESPISGFSSSQDWLEWQRPVNQETDKNLKSHADKSSDNKYLKKNFAKSTGIDAKYDTLSVMNTGADTNRLNFQCNWPRTDIFSSNNKNIERSNEQRAFKERGFASKASENSMVCQDHRSRDSTEKKDSFLMNTKSSDKSNILNPSLDTVNVCSDSLFKPQKDVTYSRNEPFRNTGIADKKSFVSGTDFPVGSQGPSKSCMDGDLENDPLITSGPSKPDRKPRLREVDATEQNASGFMVPFEHPMRKKSSQKSTALDHSKMKTKKRDKKLRQQEILGDELNLDDYETCWEVAEMLGDVKTLGLNKEEILNFPSHEYREGASNVSETECRICLTSFRRGETIRTLTCLHFFHHNCIDEWLMRNGICPVCRIKAYGF